MARRAENETSPALGALVRRARDGDREALGELFLLHAPAVRRLLASVIGPSGEIDDLVQDVFIQVHKSLPGFRGDSQFSTWLHQIAVYAAYNHLRRLRGRMLSIDPERIADLSLPEREGPHARLYGGEVLRRLHAILDSIKPKKRVAFVLFAVNGCSVGEISELVGAPVPTVKSRIWFARRELRKKARRDPYLAQLLDELETTDDER
jgi:RNA polymerase sigma-70 factor (ECF subfamily)